MPRRVVLLRRDHFAFPVSPSTLRRAMREMAPTIKAPLRKMHRIETITRRATEYQISLGSMYRNPAVPRNYKTPRPAEWQSMLAARAVDDATFGQHATSAYFYLDAVLPMMPHEIDIDFGAIPFEERVLLVTIQDMALALSLQNR